MVRPAKLIAGIVSILLLSACAAPSGDPKSPTAPTEVELYVLEALDAIEKYGYFVDGSWPAQVAKTRDATSDVTSVEETYGPLSIALYAGGGSHSALIRPPVAEIEPSDKLIALPVVSSPGGGVSRIELPSVNTSDVTAMAEYAESGSSALTAALDSTECGWIVDLRGNPGGSVYPMLLAVAPLLPEHQTVLGFEDRRGELSEVRLVGNRVEVDGEVILEAEVSIERVSVPVVVLQDSITASAAEAVAIAFRGQEASRAIGTPTAGYPTGNVTHELADGAVLVITHAVDVDRTGATYRQSLEPDLEVLGWDAQLTAATEWLHAAC